MFWHAVGKSPLAIKRGGFLLFASSEARGSGQTTAVGMACCALEASGLLDARRVLLAPLHFYQFPSSTWVSHFLKLPAKKKPSPSPSPSDPLCKLKVNVFQQSSWNRPAILIPCMQCWRDFGRAAAATCLLVAQARYQNRVASAKIRDYLREQLPQQEMIEELWEDFPICFL